MNDTKTQKEGTPRIPIWIYVVFFLSGFAALVYQVVWQRSLFAIYGINVESVTVVVTAFMLGLGLGSLVGGALSKNPSRPVLLFFALIEIGIGLFGAVSLSLFHEIGAATLHLSAAVTGTMTFLLVLIPTLLMGSTLPLLVAFLVRLTGNVGRSLGMLYFVNTLGSAVAAIISVLYLLRFLGQTGSVQFAVVCNLLVGFWVLGQYMNSRRKAT
jgi:spermidine synthase